VRQLYQRYAMLTLDFALNDNVHQTHWSFPKLGECRRWIGVTMCNDSNEVSDINWARKNLTGTIPYELGLLSDSLVRVDLAQNQLKGNLEPIYKLHSAKEIYIFKNELTGQLEKQLENLQSLTKFMVNENSLTGTLPALQMRQLGTWFCFRVGLQNMRLQQTDLMSTSTVIFFYQEWFNVQANRLSGPIPESMVLNRVKYFDISKNALTGSIPSHFATEIVPNNIRHLHINHNQITGSVPTDFTQLGKGRILCVVCCFYVFLHDHPICMS
jgi:hypothetical protein